MDAQPLYVVPEGVETRWASPENPRGERGAAGQANAGRKGSACFPLKAGGERVLAEASGRSGIVRRSWITIDKRTPQVLRGTRLDFYWDGASRPAVSAPLGDFFGIGLGRVVPFQSALFSSPEGRSFNCYIPMPFRTGMRLVATNESRDDIGAFYYDVDYTLGDRHEPDAVYLHAHFRRECPTTMQRDYELLPRVGGRGRFLGVNVGVIANRRAYFKSWWGEGEVKIYVDEDPGATGLPTLCGTGTEDYIGTGWGQGVYAHAYQGCPVAELENMRYCFYRYHVPDPVYFARNIRVTIQQIGCWEPVMKPLMHGSGQTYYKAGPGRVPVDLSPTGGSADYGLFERADDWSSCAYFYLDRAEDDLPPLEPPARRMAGCE